MRRIWLYFLVLLVVHTAYGQAIQEIIEFDPERARQDISEGFEVSRRLGPPPPNYAMPGKEILEIGSRPQFFLDNYIIENMFELERRMHHPRRFDKNPILDATSFRTTQPYLSVIYDPEYKGGKYRLWYNSNDPVYQVESEDGLHWENPQVAWDLDRAYGVGVLDDREREKNPARRFKAINWQATRTREDKPSDDGGLYVGFSRDGFNFKKLERSVLPSWPEGYLVLSYYGASDISRPHWDPFNQQYACILKIFLIPGENYITGPRCGMYLRRVIGISFSDDFINWTEPRRIIMPDNMDRGLFEYYAMGGIHVGGDLMIGLIRTLNDDLSHEPDMPDAQGIGATVLAISRDGKSWHRFREPFLDRNPEAGTWDRSMTWASAVLPVGEQLYIYYGGYKSGHKTDRRTDRQIGVAFLKRDRYMSLAGGEWGGEMVTKPFVFKGNRLVLNINTLGGGCAWIELRDGNNNTFQNYRFEDCDLIQFHDSLDYTVTWNGNSNVQQLEGKPVRLAVRLKQAKLFTFQFVSDVEE